MSSVLEATPPRFTAEDVARIAAELFGLDGRAVDLGSERDQTFLVEGPHGAGVVKISNLGEKAETLDLEAEAILHVARVDPDLPVARPQVVVPGEAGALRDAATFRSHRQDLQAAQLARLAEALPLPQLHLPALFDVAIGLPQIDELARALATGIESLEVGP